MSLNYILPNGVTMQFANEAERDTFLAGAAGVGGQTQADALAANPGMDIGQIKNANHTAHYGTDGSLSYILPNGATMQFANPTERDAFLASPAGAGAVMQKDALAANPGMDIGQIKNNNYNTHYGPDGAQGTLADAINAAVEPPAAAPVPAAAPEMTPVQAASASAYTSAAQGAPGSTTISSDGSIKRSGVADTAARLVGGGATPPAKSALGPGGGRLIS